MGLFAFIIVGVVAVAAVGIVGYTIYKAFHEKEDKHKSKGSKPPGDPRRISIQELVTYEDMKLKSETNSGIRHRNIDTDKNGEVEKAVPVSTVSSNICQETQTANLISMMNGNNNLSNEKSHQETQTAALISNQNNFNLSNMISHQETQTTDLSSEQYHQDSQTTNSLSDLDLILGNTNYNINNLGARSLYGENSTVCNGTESVYSFDSTVTSSSNASSTTCIIPSWHEMSDAQKGACRCTPCGGIVTTVTYPCKHPYFCSACATTMFKFYHRCPSCKRRIKSYDNIF